MRIGSCAGRQVALLNRAASIGRCVVYSKAALLIVSFPVASSLTCCMHQQMHMFALFRQVHLRSIEPRHSQGMCPIRLAAGLSCLSACLLDQACWFPLLPLNHHLVVFCIHKCISCELCVDASEGADLQPLPHPLLLAVDSYSRWKASSSSRVRVAFPCHGLEALFSFDVCVSEAVPFIQAHCCRHSVHSRSALPVSTDTKFGRDKPFCFPCVFPLHVVVSLPAVLLPCSCWCLVCDHALPWFRWILLFPSAHRRRPLCKGFPQASPT